MRNCQQVSQILGKELRHLLLKVDQQALHKLERSATASVGVGVLQVLANVLEWRILEQFHVLFLQLQVGNHNALANRAEGVGVGKQRVMRTLSNSVQQSHGMRNDLFFFVGPWVSYVCGEHGASTTQLG